MKNRILSLCVVAALLLTFFPMSAFPASAATVVDSGYCGKNVQWTLDSDGTLTIFGSGPMNDYSSTAQIPWNDYGWNTTDYTKLTSVVIKDGVTSIGKMAFYSCKGVTSVEIPLTVERIGSGAFEHCIRLKSVVIPGSVNTIGIDAFSDCQRLETLVLSDGIETIGRSAFFGCISLSSVTVPSSVRFIDESAFGSAPFLSGILADIYITNPKCDISDNGFGDTLGDPSLTVIHAPKGSPAETYAERYGYDYAQLEPEAEDDEDVEKRLIQVNYYDNEGIRRARLHYDDNTGLLERVTFSYDYDEDFPSADYVYEYDAENRLVKVECGNIEDNFYSFQQMEFNYDEIGRLVKWWEFSPGLGYWEGYCTYDDQGRLVQTSGEWEELYSEITDFTYDDSGLLVEAVHRLISDYSHYVDTDTTITKYQYDNQNRVSRQIITSKFGTVDYNFIYDYPPFVIKQYSDYEDSAVAYYDLGYLSDMNFHLADDFFSKVYGPFAKCCEINKWKIENGYFTLIEKTDAVEKGEFIWEKAGPTVNDTEFFILEKDNNSFDHTASSFFRFDDGEKKEYLISDDYFQLLLDQGSLFEDCILRSEKEKVWNGACYGLSVSMALASVGGLSDVTHGRNYCSLSAPKETELEPNFRNIIHYYHLLQNIQKPTCKTYESSIDNFFKGGVSLEDFLESFIDEAVRGEAEQKPFILGYLYEGGGHAVVVCGYDTIEKEGKLIHRIKLYDPNAWDLNRYYYFDVSADHSSFSFTDKRGRKLEDIYRSLRFYDIDTLLNAEAYRYSHLSTISGETLENTYSNFSRVSFPADEKFTLTNAEGQAIYYDGESYGGTMTIYDTEIIGEERLKIELLLDASAEFVLSDFSDTFELAIELDGSFYMGSAVGSDSIVFRRDGTIEFQGASYQFSGAVSTNLASCDMVRFSGQVEGSCIISPLEDKLCLNAQDKGEQLVIDIFSGVKQKTYTLDDTVKNITIQNKINDSSSVSVEYTPVDIPRLDYVLGDVNGDGKIDYSDALLVLRASISLETLTETQILAGDVTGNGKLTYEDALLILRASIGLAELD